MAYRSGPQAGATAQVRRRHVFFFAGFDPKGASFYHGLCQREAPRQAAVAGYRIEVGPRLKTPGRNDCWNLNVEQGGARCDTVIEHVRWDDIVRRHWPRRSVPLLWEMACSYAYAVRSGMIGSVRRLAPKALIAWLYPLAYVLLTTLIGMSLALGASVLAQRAEVAVWVHALLVAGLGVLVLWFAIRLEDRLNTTWLARIFRFASLAARDRVPELEQRIDAAAQQVARRLREPGLDEVLLVGFSVGSMLAASAAARALRLLGDEPALARLSLLTLGHCVPVLSCLPEARRFRDELAQLGGAASLVWVDYSSTTDWGSFAGVDPVMACSAGDASPAQGSRRFWLSPRFHRLFDAESYLRLRRDKRRMHLQYLMAGERAGDYDYFALTGGTRALGQPSS